MVLYPNKLPESERVCSGICIFIGILSIIPIQLHARKYYCEIKGMQKELSSGFKIVFDFGESQVYSI